MNLINGLVLLRGHLDHGRRDTYSRRRTDNAEIDRGQPGACRTPGDARGQRTRGRSGHPRRAAGFGASRLDSSQRDWIELCQATSCGSTHQRHSDHHADGPYTRNGQGNGARSRSAPLLSDEVVEIAGLRLDPAAHRITGNGQKIDLKATEFRMLHFFMTHPDRVYSRAQLLDEVWGDHVFVEERTVDVHIRRVRQVLAPSGHEGLIETVRGMGYRFRRQPA